MACTIARRERLQAPTGLGRPTDVHLPAVGRPRARTLIVQHDVHAKHKIEGRLNHVIAGVQRMTKISVAACRTIQTFGGLSIGGGMSPVILRSVKQRQLLRWLALAAWGGPLLVTTVCDNMWPSVDGAAALSNFSSSIRRLRVLLGGASSIQVEAGTVRLNPNTCRTDLDLLFDVQAALRSATTVESASHLALQMLAAFDGGNSVLRAPSPCQDIEMRIKAVETAWTHATLHLCRRLQGTVHAALGLELCERIEHHGLADIRILKQWQSLAGALGAPAEYAA